VTQASRGFQGDPTAPVPGLPDGKTVLLNGLASASGTGARRYTLNSKQPCQALSAPGLELSDSSGTPSSSGSSGSLGALGRRGGASSVDGASAERSPGAGVASCIINADRGQFECSLALPGSSSGSMLPSSTSGSRFSTVGSRKEACAPVVRTTISGNTCYLPFMWKGALRDDCVWHNGMEICPVLATAAELAAAAGLGSSEAFGPALPPTPATWGSTASANAAANARNGSSSSSTLVAAGAPWRWEQCTKDYVTKFDAPRTSQATPKRWVA